MNGRQLPQSGTLDDTGSSTALAGRDPKTPTVLTPRSTPSGYEIVLWRILERILFGRVWRLQAGGLAGAVAAALCITGMLMAAAPVLAAERLSAPPDGRSAVESGRRALARQADFPWYDAARDDLRRLDVRPPKDLKNRHSRWETPPPPTGSLPRWLWILLEVFGWTLLVVAIVLLVVALVRAYLLDASATDETAKSSAADTVPRGAPDRVDALPFALKAAQSDLLEEARRCYENGEYGQAVVYLYSYQLVQLDRHQCIRLAKGKTNRQYLREVRRQPLLFQLLERTMVAFEDVFFGRHTLDRSRFESCWNRLGQFHQLLEQGAS